MPKNPPPQPSADAGRLAVDLIDEFRVAQSSSDHDRMTAVMLAAHALDRKSPAGPRLMDEIRAMRRGVER